MSTLFQAPQFEPAREQRRRKIVLIVIIVVVVVAALLWIFRYWPQEHKVSRFFAALEQKDYEGAYAVYMNDPAWKQHPDQYKRYSYGDFYTDWGPGGEWGIIRSHKVEGAARPRGGSGVVVQVTVNDRKTPACVWADDDKTLTAPSPLPCGNL